MQFTQVSFLLQYSNLTAYTCVFVMFQVYLQCYQISHRGWHLSSNIEVFTNIRTAINMLVLPTCFVTSLLIGRRDYKITYTSYLRGYPHQDVWSRTTQTSIHIWFVYYMLPMAYRKYRGHLAHYNIWYTKSTSAK